MWFSADIGRQAGRKAGRQAARQTAHRIRKANNFDCDIAVHSVTGTSVSDFVVTF